MVEVQDEAVPVYLIRGLRARPAKEWFQHATMPAILSYLASADGVLDELPEWVQAGCAAFLVVQFLVKLARGRIALYPDRLWIRSWNDSFLNRTVTIPLSTIHKVALYESALRIGYRSDDQARHVKLSLLAPVAEELYDRLLEQVSEHPKLAGRVEESSPRRFLIAAPRSPATDPATAR